MLTITIDGREYFDQEQQVFIDKPTLRLDFEHSLASLSKWESKHGKAFLSTKEKTRQEMFDYIALMCLTEGAFPEALSRLDSSHIKEIQTYLDSQQTATTFSNQSGAPSSREVITAEIIYYWMVEQGVPFECQYWHLNRLLTLLRVVSIKRAPSKKMSRREAMSQQRSLNAQRRAAAQSRG